MPSLPRLLLPLAAALVLSCDKDDPAPRPIEGPGSSPSSSDVVDVTDLLVAESSGAGAIQIGDPAELLGYARKESLESVARLRSVLQRLQDVASGRDPDKRGTWSGLPYGAWTATKDGLDLKLLATVLEPTRIRYLALGKKQGEAAYRTLLTGIFLKQAPTKGGGRIHLNLTNISDLGGGAADGEIQVWWSNAKPKLVARRALYRGVKDRGGAYPDPRNYGMDYVRNEGVGGRFRTFVVGDLAPKIPGNEALAVRMLWSTSQGGRADAVLLNKTSSVTVRSHECWDQYGNRTAHENDAALDDADNPNEGDVASCWGFARDDYGALPDENAVDVDPDVDAELKAAGGIGVSEAEAADATNPEG